MSATAFKALAGVRDYDGHVGILIEYLLNAAGITADFALWRNFISRFVGVLMADSRCRLAKCRGVIVIA